MRVLFWSKVVSCTILRIVYPMRSEKWTEVDSGRILRFGRCCNFPVPTNGNSQEYGIWIGIRLEGDDVDELLAGKYVCQIST